MPNVLAIAKWLQAPVPAGVLSFGEEFRPVELELVVEGYPQHSNDFLFNRQLGNHVEDVLNRRAHGRPTLLFCNSRKDAKETCERLQQSSTFHNVLASEEMQPQGETRRTMASKIGDASLRTCALNGFAWHHAQVSAADRKVVERMFRERLIAVLTCTFRLSNLNAW